ncbi:MAG: hypothetical protein A2452_06175 [Candidatus Firestonebacteria bacterium RIFOXYC2_FULL_39_67]|nr:MAG: hypothetical protein A2536_12290 [Candidatus Firestonebacteria bacterium RIFOXYD2_FULL_39_29]OGF54857.1 MAG: hypothetical protein A2497_03820 [Candidatus Firestonebacteria bacterium RifOxyC12_full_39_7]OGF56671.1 MAG: hypothetical protein A2452_06175 [Candidatus Firestonebacteria bacterium RIFOXYC2_FULL_39_67]
MITFIKLILYSLLIFVVTSIVNVLIVILLTQIFPGYMAHHISLTYERNIGELIARMVGFTGIPMDKILILMGIRPYGEIIYGIFCIFYLLMAYLIFIWQKGKHKRKIIQVFVCVFIVYVSIESFYYIRDWNKFLKNKAEIIKVSQITTKNIYDDIVKIQKSYPELVGFKDNASFLNNGNVYSELKFENNVGPISEENPGGVLNTPQSCFFRVYIKCSPEWFKHKVLPSGHERLYHIDYLGNNCIYIETVINVSSDKFSEKLWQIVWTNLSALHKIDQSKTFVCN